MRGDSCVNFVPNMLLREARFQLAKFLCLLTRSKRINFGFAFLKKNHELTHQSLGACLLFNHLSGQICPRFDLWRGMFLAKPTLMVVILLSLIVTLFAQDEVWLPLDCQLKMDWIPGPQYRRVGLNAVLYKVSDSELTLEIQNLNKTDSRTANVHMSEGITLNRDQCSDANKSEGTIMCNWLGTAPSLFGSSDVRIRLGSLILRNGVLEKSLSNRRLPIFFMGKTVSGAGYCSASTPRIEE